MQTRRDLYQAHRLMMQRVGLALLQGEPDVAESPMRRLSVSAFAGAMVAVLIAAVFGVLGLIAPSGARGLDRGGMVIIERETGTKYVYNVKAKVMQPVLNYASAKLALNASNPPQRVVSRKSLAKFSRGAMIGIPGAPDSLPDPDHLVKKPWSVCVRTGSNIAGGTRPVTSLVAGKSVGGRPIGPDDAIMVEASGQTYVIWHSMRMRMTLPPNQASSVTNVQPAQVNQTWLSPIDEGPPFTAPAIAGRGDPVPGTGGNVGQVFRTPTGSYYVLQADGFAQISQTQATLLLADPDTARLAYHGQGADFRDIDVSRVNGRLSAHTLIDSRLPPTMPHFVSWDATTPLCAVFADADKGSTSAQMAIGGTLPDVQGGALANGIVDQVILPPGGAALVSLLPGAGQLNAINAWYIINDAGICFPLLSKDTVEKLGYNVGEAAPVPKGVLGLLQTGPTLSPAAALKLAPVPKAGG